MKSFNTIFDGRYIKINKQTDFQFRQFKICYDLSLMNRVDFIGTF